MSKKQFKGLKANAYIFVDEKLTKKVNQRYTKPWLTYYRFDINRMIEKGGYKVVQDSKSEVF